MKSSRLLIAAALAAAALFAMPAGAQSPTLSFTADSTPSGSNVITKLTWATTPAATSCTASGDWSGTKTAAGTVTLPAVAPPKSYTLKCAWPGDTTATVRWGQPTTNTDGSPLTDLASYKVYRSMDAATIDAPTSTVRVVPAPGLSSVYLNLSPGTHFFAVKATNAAGLDSVLSNVASKTITPAVELTQTVGVKVPSVVTNVLVE